MFLLKYLYDHTDMDHQITSAELRKVLKENDYPSDPRTIRSQIDKMCEAGYDIIINARSGIATTYCYAARVWDQNDVRILIDAVSSAPFITRARTDELIEKLSILPGREYQDLLTPQVYISEHIKAENVNLMRTIDIINAGIQQRKKISYQMFNYNAQKQQLLRHGGEVYILSPYDTVWKNDHYYVVGHSDKYDKPISTRIDRMVSPVLLEEDAVPKRKDYNVQDYTDYYSNMYGGAITEVTLRCQNYIADYVFEKFGKDNVDVFNDGHDTFDAKVTAAVSGTFLSWVFTFAGAMIILSPEPVRQMYAEMMDTARAEMTAGEFTRIGERHWKL